LFQTRIGHRIVTIVISLPRAANRLSQMVESVVQTVQHQDFFAAHRQPLPEIQYLPGPNERIQRFIHSFSGGILAALPSRGWRTKTRLGR
jgi:hypothetical protein